MITDENAIELLKEVEGAYLPLIEESTFKLKAGQASIITQYFKDNEKYFEGKNPIEISDTIAEALNLRSEFVQGMFLFWDWIKKNGYWVDGELNTKQIYTDYAKLGKHATFPRVMRDINPKPAKSDAVKHFELIRKRIGASLKKADAVNYQAFKNDSNIESINEALTPIEP